MPRPARASCVSQERLAARDTRRPWPSSTPSAAQSRWHPAHLGAADCTGHEDPFTGRHRGAGDARLMEAKGTPVLGRVPRRQPAPMGGIPTHTIEAWARTC